MVHVARIDQKAEAVLPPPKDLLHEKSCGWVAEIEVYTLGRARIVIGIEEQFIGIGGSAVSSNNSVGTEPYVSSGAQHLQNFRSAKDTVVTGATRRPNFRVTEQVIAIHECHHKDGFPAFVESFGDKRNLHAIYVGPFLSEDDIVTNMDLIKSISESYNGEISRWKL